MSWESLRKRLDKLPLVIAGPILRRVEKDSVSVWIACKKDQQLQLVVCDFGNAPILRSPTMRTVAVGENLHVAVLTATQFVGSTSSLQPGQVYQYDILFNGQKGLGDSGILNPPDSPEGAIEKISYGTPNGTLRLPSFVLPANTVAGLKLVHGSCRKAHGGMTDAMAALNTMLASTWNKPSIRLQQLFLTGDQIYADDVADSLLFMLMDASDALLGWKEGEFPKRRERHELMASHGFTSGEKYDKSHLIGLGEFYAMYLFVWSQELWPVDFPDFKTVFPEDKYCVTTDHVVAETVLRTDDFECYLLERQGLRMLQDALPSVRKALANIPSYMILDDHEVCDDLFLDLAWTAKVYSRPFGKRVIQNGLCAYAVFQAWGNTPAAFADDSTYGGKLLGLLEQLNDDRGTQPNTWTEIEGLVLPRLSIGGGGWLDSVIQWDYAINFAAHQVVVLDTRTHRGFWPYAEAPELIVENDLRRQLRQRDSSAKLTILVSPAPVIGHDKVEEFVQPAAKQAWNVVSAFTKTRGVEEFDYEAWSCNSKSYQNLLAKLVAYGQVVILSGDVHYAFSASIEYWDDRTSPNRAAFAQLCCSSLKNEEGKTHTIAWGADSGIVRPQDEAVWLGWASPGSGKQIKQACVSPTGVSVYRLPIRGNGDPPLHKFISTTDCVDVAPQWQYRVRFAKDARGWVERGLPTAQASGGNSQQIAAGHQQKVINCGPQAVVVGRDNIGVIEFEWGNARQTIIHTLWYVAQDLGEDTSLLAAHTRHEVNLAIPDENAKPGRRCDG